MSLSNVRYIRFYHGGTCDIALEGENPGNIGVSLAQASVIISILDGN